MNAPLQAHTRRKILWLVGIVRGEISGATFFYHGTGGNDLGEIFDTIDANFRCVILERTKREYI